MCNSSDIQDEGKLSAGESVLFFFIILPVVLAGGALLQNWKLREGTLVTEWCLILAPTLLFLKIRGKHAAETLKINLPQNRHLLASLVLALSAIPLITELSVIQDSVFPIPEELIEAMNRAFTFQEGESILVTFLAFSVTPAICEETLFRGVLLQGFLSRLGRNRAVFYSGLLFGLFHLNIYRFLPTACIGMIIGYLVVMSSSLLPGILYHAVNNAFALSALNITSLRNYPWLYEESHIPLPILFISVAAFYYGIKLLKPAEANPVKLPEQGGVL